MGIECYPEMPVLRVHLNLPEHEGLVVGKIAPDSPAAKAGVETNDILMQEGEKKLTSVQDLIEAVESTKETPLRLELIHADKLKTIEIASAKRPKDVIFRQEGTPAVWNEIGESMQKLHGGARFVWPAPGEAGAGAEALDFTISVAPAEKTGI
ncbi:MAG TPA: PDZ domain-containing protein [bacterium]|nr:PDZ domain-containing protein [bacterium]